MQRRDFIRSTVAAASLGGLLGVEGNIANAQPAAVPGASRVADRVDGSGLQLSLAAYSFRRAMTRSYSLIPAILRSLQMIFRQSSRHKCYVKPAKPTHSTT